MIIIYKMDKYVSIGMMNTASNTAKASRAVLKQIEDREDWVVSDKESLANINDLLKDWGKIVLNDKKSQEGIIKLMAMVGTGDMVNIVEYIKSRNDDFLFNELLAEMNKGDNEYSRLVIKRFLTLYRVALIPKVFSIDRLNAIHEQIKIQKNK